MSDNRRLTGIGVLITRPAHQAGTLAARVKELGGLPWLFPVLEISDVENKQPLLDLIARLGKFDWAIFVSPNAVEKVLPLILAQHSWPGHLNAATVGMGSARLLKQYGISNITVPDDGTDSEALLRMPQLQQMQGQRVVIFRGNDGRKLLGDTLRQRGAEVEYAACYRRTKPDTDPGQLLKCWHANKIHAVIVTSSEGLDNLIDIIGETGQQLLRSTVLFTAHDRIVQKAQALGIIKVYRTSVGDEGTVQGLLDYFNDIQAHEVT
ncbi:MAG TPA: uroporphyrinogen-III synthase [Nitrosomonas halophila]|nr:uroporphyrinogen-III synthase [Nitrosomonas halophila]